MMPTHYAIAAYDVVELIEPVDDVPAGARGGVLELGDDGRAMIEVTSLPLDVVDRIVFAPLAKLRRVSAPGKPHGVAA
jgi:hypothetical protein